MYLEILTPESKVFSGEVALISLPGSSGAFEILQNHAPIVSTLEPGRIKVVGQDGKTSLFDIKEGVIECLDNQVHVLVTIE